MYLLTNVAKPQDVPLNATIFLGNTGQKDRATIMNKIFLYSYPNLVETYRNQVLQHRSTIKTPDMIYLLTNVLNPVLQHSLTTKARGDVHANKCCYNLGCPVGRYYFFR